MVLSELRETGNYRVKQLKVGGDIGRHLQDMGFLPGEPITVVSHFDGNIIVNVKGTRVALSEQMAKSIMI